MVKSLSGSKSKKELCSSQASANKKRKKKKRSDKRKRRSFSCQKWSASARGTFFGKLRIFQVKLADLSNACWINHHFPMIIQTPPYRSPESIIGSRFGPPADIWSLACVAFELMTGEPLFDANRKDCYHLTQMQNYLGDFPIDYTCSGESAKHFFTKNGKLKCKHNFRS